MHYSYCALRGWISRLICQHLLAAGCLLGVAAPEAIVIYHHLSPVTITERHTVPPVQYS